MCFRAIATRFNRVIYLFIIMGIAIPTNFVTLTKVMQLTQLINTQWGIIILYSAAADSVQRFLVLCVYCNACRASSTKRQSLTDAVRLRLFFSVIYPLLTPVLVTASVSEPARHLERVSCCPCII